MTTRIVVSIPPSVLSYQHHLKNCFDGLVKKLDANSHKQTPTEADIPAIIDLMVEEIDEFETQLKEDKFNENTLVELMDAANFAFLAYVALRFQGVEHEREAPGKSSVG